MSLPIDPRRTTFGAPCCVVLPYIISVNEINLMCNWHDYHDPSKLDGGPAKILTAYSLPMKRVNEKLGYAVPAVGIVRDKEQIVTLVEYVAHKKEGK